jgi:hypothetical protein
MGHLVHYQVQYSKVIAFSGVDTHYATMPKVGRGVVTFLHLDWYLADIQGQPLDPRVVNSHYGRQYSLAPSTAAMSVHVIIALSLIGQTLAPTAS